MSLYLNASVLASAPVDGTALTNTTTQTSILPPTAIVDISKNDLVVGRKFLVMASGRISTVVTTPGTIQFFVRLLGGSGVNVAASGALALNVVAKANVTWRLTWELSCRAIGSGTSANFLHTGTWESEAVIGSPLPTVGGCGELLIPANTPAAGAGFDSTIVQPLDFQAQWSVANAANSIQLHQYTVLAVP